MAEDSHIASHLVTILALAGPALAQPPTFVTSIIAARSTHSSQPSTHRLGYSAERLESSTSSHTDVPVVLEHTRTRPLSHDKAASSTEDVLRRGGDQDRVHCSYPYLTCSSHHADGKVVLDPDLLDGGGDSWRQHPLKTAADGSSSRLREELPGDNKNFDTLEGGNGSTHDFTLRKIPQYVFDYAPFVYLYSGEEFWPGDIAEHLEHTAPYLEYTPLNFAGERRNLSNLNDMNIYGRRVFLTSDDNVEDRPEWLGGRNNIPEDFRLRNGSTNDTLQECNPENKDECAGGRSNAPAVLIVVPKPNGVVDAFWWYFYSYNLGQKVFRIRFGNHVGDWEHTVVRFRNGTPETVFMSQHEGGDAFNYSAVEKIGKRPVVYSAIGSHANYGTPGIHRYVLPWGLLHDVTDRGPLWDPALNSYSYMYNMRLDKLFSANDTREQSTEWFFYNGHWGDKYYPMSDTRQYQFAGQYHYVSGPWGPRLHNLGRQEICAGHGPCIIKESLAELDVRFRLWMNDGEFYLAPVVFLLALVVLAATLCIIRCVGRRKERVIRI